MHEERAIVLADVAKALIAGAVVTWAMEKATGSFREQEDEEARNRYEEVTGGRYPPMRMAEEADDLLHLGLSEEQRPSLAQGLHWAYGLGAASAYAFLRRRSPRGTAGRGLLFGALFSLIGDEIMTTVTGLAEPPREYPWQAHTRGFVSHLAFGLSRIRRSTCWAAPPEERRSRHVRTCGPAGAPIPHAADHGVPRPPIPSSAGSGGGAGPASPGSYRAGLFGAAGLISNSSTLTTPSPGASASRGAPELSADTDWNREFLARACHIEIL